MGNNIYSVDISYDSDLIRTSFDGVPDDCTELHIKGNLIKTEYSNGKTLVYGATSMSIYSLNCFLKNRPKIKVLDMSACIDTTEIKGGFSNIYVKTIILPPNVYKSPRIYSCPNLTTLKGSGLTVILNISDCPSLENIYFCEKLSEIKIPNTNIRSLKIPNVQIVDDEAFCGCRNLEHIEFSPKLKRIGSSAFKNCSALYKINIPDLCNIEQDAFYGCSALTYLNLPNKLETLNRNVFANCYSLKYITGGHNIKTILAGAFSNCYATSYLPILPKNIDENTFDKVTDNHIGFLLTSNRNSIIWCFDTKSFFLCENDVDYDFRERLVMFSANHRFTYSIDENGIHIVFNPCQTAFNLDFDFEVDDISNHVSVLDIPKSIQYYNIEKAVKAFELMPKKFPDVMSLYDDIANKIRCLDLSKIISAYHTEVSESQTWKVGGDNTLHWYKKTSYLYTDTYLEKFLPIYDEEYHESACYDFSNEINNDAQSAQNEFEAKIKIEFWEKYNEKDHVVALVDDFIQKYLLNCKLVQDVLSIEFSKNVLNKYFQSYSRHINSHRIKSLSLLCSGDKPPLDYEVWLENRYKTMFENIF